MPTSARVFVGRLPRFCRENDLERYFGRYGRIRDVMCKANYGFVEFDDYRDAEDAVYELHGRDFQGERIIVEMARGRPRGRDRFAGSATGGARAGPFNYAHGYEVTVENLSSRMSWQDLKQMFSRCGEILRADVEPAKREGTLWFAKKTDAKHALEKYDGKEVSGREIKIKLREKRSPSRSRSRSAKRKASRSASGSRSRSPPKKRKRSKSGSRSKSPADKGSRSPEKRSKSPEKRSGSEKSTKDEAEENGDRADRRSRSGSPAAPKKERVDSGATDESPRRRSGSKKKSRSRSRSKSGSD